MQFDVSPERRQDQHRQFLDFPMRFQAEAVCQKGLEHEHHVCMGCAWVARLRLDVIVFVVYPCRGAGNLIWPKAIRVEDHAQNAFVVDDEPATGRLTRRGSSTIFVLLDRCDLKSGTRCILSVSDLIAQNHERTDENASSDRRCHCWTSI